MAAVGDVLQLISTTRHPYNVDVNLGAEEVEGELSGTSVEACSALA